MGQNQRMKYVLLQTGGPAGADCFLLNIFIANSLTKWGLIQNKIRKI